MAKIIRFDDEVFNKLIKEPAQPDTNKRARLIYKVCEIYYRMKEVKENGNKN